MPGLLNCRKKPSSAAGSRLVRLLYAYYIHEICVGIGICYSVNDTLYYIHGDTLARGYIGIILTT